MKIMNTRYKDDLDFLINKYEEIFPMPYYCFSKKQMTKYIDDYLDSNVIESELQFLYFLRCIIKKLNGVLDSHTTVKKKGQFFPFVFKMFNEDLYVSKTTKQTEELLYCKLATVNGISYKKLIPEIENTISYSTNGWRKRCLERSFNELYSLLQLPSLNTDKNKIQLEFKDLKNKTVLFTFKENDYQEGIPYDKENGSFDIFNGTVHYIYNSCKNEEKIKESIKSLQNCMNNHHIHNFILDLRGNTGGNDAIIFPLVNYLKNLDIKIYTFVDRYTFSSGIGALLDSIKVGAFVIGEDIGSSLNHFGSSSAIFNLPNTNFKLVLSTKYIDETCLHDENCDEIFQKGNDFLKPQIFKPNIIIEETIDDYINNRDLCMEKFKELLT